jgi:hypothetical protein
MRHLSIRVQFSFHSRLKLAQSCQKKSNFHTNSLNKLQFAWDSRMENICSVRQQSFEICRMRHELIEIEEYTPWSYDNPRTTYPRAFQRRFSVNL